MRIFAISVDTPEQNTRLRQRLGSDFSFLSDSTLALINRMHIPYKRSSKGEGPLAIPSQFLVDRAGVIRWKYISDTWRRRLPPDKVLVAIAAAMEGAKS